MNVIMDPEIQRILEDAQRLSPLKRSALAVSILESLEESPDPGAEKAWDAEADRRLEELKSGRAREIPWDEARDLILGKSCPPGA